MACLADYVHTPGLQGTEYGALLLFTVSCPVVDASEQVREAAGSSFYRTSHLLVVILPVGILPNFAIHYHLDARVPQTRQQTARQTMMILRQPNRLQLPIM
jgi:hypothetical protein